MNIFALSHSPIVSAQMQHDKHVVKMLESAQICSTFDPNIYDVLYRRGITIIHVLFGRGKHW